MLDELHVRNYALVKDAALSFSPRCTVLTGETGAGKTALVGAIKLLIGERGDAAAVSDGTPELIVEGRIYNGQNEQVVSRRLSSEGRSRCVLNESMTTVKGLADAVGACFDLHGQHEHQSLLSTAVQLQFLDRFATAFAADGTSKLQAYELAWDAYSSAAAELRKVQEAAKSSELALEQARFTLREIDAVKPVEGELEALESELPILRNGENLANASGAAHEFLSGDDGAIIALSKAAAALQKELGVDARLDEACAQLESLAISADDLGATLRSYHDSVDFDPHSLGRALDRLGELEGLRKRFGPRMEDVFLAQAHAAEQIEACENSEEKIAQAHAVVDECAAQLREQASALEELRQKAGYALCEQLNTILADLAMGNSMVEYQIKTLLFEKWQRTGSATYELMYKPTAAAIARPLAKIASGGELSRVMLALKTCAREPDEQTTMVFDEVDAGIGGATATSVAKYIASLANTNQLIVITHLAQIAAVADRHYVVEKAGSGADVQTCIHEVQGDERVKEIARMLSGSTDEIAIKHAKQLLKGGE